MHTHFMKILGLIISYFALTVEETATGDWRGVGLSEGCNTFICFRRSGATMKKNNCSGFNGDKCYMHTNYLEI